MNPAMQKEKEKENIRGALLMSGSMAGFVINDSLMKQAFEEVSLYPALLVRGIVASLLLGILAWRTNALLITISREDMRGLGYRAIGEIGSTLCFLTALIHMPLANATAILQSMPLAVTLAAAVFLHESVGWRRYFAIFIGFFGVLLIVQPGTEGFNSYSLFAVLAVFFLVIRDLSTRQLSPAMPSAFVALTAAVLIMCVGFVGSLAGTWQPISWKNLIILCSAACFIVLGYIFAVMAMRVGDIAFVSPFRYTILIWALGLGYLVFGDIPDTLSVVGIIIVAGTGVFSFYRERIRTRMQKK